MGVSETDCQYDVALSFAGEQREYVKRVALTLRSLGVRVFYDGFEEENLWGKDLYEYLHEIYSSSARYTVIFVSQQYAEKLWTSHERKSAQERAFRESREYILPARFDDTRIPGIQDTTGFIDCTKRSPEELAGIIARKLGHKAPDPALESRREPDLRFRDLGFSHETLIGLLVHAGARGWCVASNRPAPPNAERVSKLVTIVPSEAEVFRERQTQAIEAFKASRKALDDLSQSIGCPLQVLSPLAMAPSTYDRFVKSDKKYILRSKSAIQPFTVPIPLAPDRHLVLIGLEGKDFFAYPAPYDYLRDAFGIEASRDPNNPKALVLRESTFLRNAKFLAVDAESSRFLAFAGIDRELQLKPAVNSRSEIVESIHSVVSADRKSISLSPGSHVEETDEQRARRQSQASVECDLCQDTGEMVVSHNLRRYRVPCPDCRSDENRSWSAFDGAFKAAKRDLAAQAEDAEQS